MRKLKTFLDKNSNFKDHYKDGFEVQILGVDTDRARCDIRIDSKERLSLLEERHLKHAQRIGLSGWNWKEKKSYWVAFDFDSTIGHNKGLTEVQLTEIVLNCKEVPWVMVRRSTSGNGLHLYVYFEKPIETKDRKEHRLLSEAILGQLSGLVGFNFREILDCSGGIFWIWTNEPKPKSFEVLKSSTTLGRVPADWKETKVRNSVKTFANNIKHIDLSEDHKRLLHWFDKNPALWWWDAELNMLICHTHDLRTAYKELKLKGIYDTISTGRDCPNDQNCFAFPIKNGAWIVRRHGKEISEHPIWRTDKSGWRFVLYNRYPNLEDVCRFYNGQTNARGEFVFQGSVAEELINKISREPFSYPKEFENRLLKIKELKGAKISLNVERMSGEPEVDGWIAEPKKYETVVEVLREEKEISAPDEFLRHLISTDQSGLSVGSGWYLRIKDNWVEERIGEVKAACIAKGMDSKFIPELMGQCVLNPWEATNQPFSNEYPGGRKWNRASASLAFTPEIGEFPTWELLLKHCGQSLDECVLEDSWCAFNEIKCGGDYLKYWIASLFQYPTEPLPFLFFYGNQNAGKSIFHESLSLVIRNGVMKANTAITSMQGFNREIAGSVVCYVEEIDLSKVVRAYERIKDWTTAKTISIHEKGKTPYILENTTHWVMCANNIGYCPVSIGDTRISMIKVSKPKNPIPKAKLLDTLASEAPAFLYEVLNIQIPPAVDRLRIPLIESHVKSQEALTQAAEPVRFYYENTIECMGARIAFKEFVERFSMRSDNPSIWTSQKVSRSMSDVDLTKGTMDHNNLYIGNRRWKDSADEFYDFKFVEANGRLKKVPLWS